MVVLERIKNGKKQETSFIIIDAQSVKGTDTANQSGYDAGKKIKGIKRHIAVDSNGLPHGIVITTANVTDRDGAIILLEENKKKLKKVVNTMVDGGYQGPKFKDKVKKIINSTVEVAKRSELHTFKVIPKRWVVERCFAWLEKSRRLWKNCERLLKTSKGFVELAFIKILLKRF
jgi:transposase